MSNIGWRDYIAPGEFKYCIRCGRNRVNKKDQKCITCSSKWKTLKELKKQKKMTKQIHIRQAKLAYKLYLSRKSSGFVPLFWMEKK